MFVWLDTGGMGMLSVAGCSSSSMVCGNDLYWRWWRSYCTKKSYYCYYMCSVSHDNCPSVGVVIDVVFAVGGIVFAVVSSSQSELL